VCPSSIQEIEICKVWSWGFLLIQYFVKTVSLVLMLKWGEPTDTHSTVVTYACFFILFKESKLKTVTWDSGFF